jgi:hypothetical protein
MFNAQYDKLLSSLILPSVNVFPDQASAEAAGAEIGYTPAFPASAWKDSQAVANQWTIVSYPAALIGFTDQTYQYHPGYPNAIPSALAANANYPPAGTTPSTWLPIPARALRPATANDPGEVIVFSGSDGYTPFSNPGAPAQYWIRDLKLMAAATGGASSAATVAQEAQALITQAGGPAEALQAIITAAGLK